MDNLALQKYLGHMGIELSNIAVSDLGLEADEQLFQLTVTGNDENAVAEQMQSILKQFDRDEEHPVTISGQEVKSRIVLEPATQVNGQYMIIGINTMLYS